MCEKLGYSAEGASDYVAVERNYVELYDAKQSSNYDKFFNTKTQYKARYAMDYDDQTKFSITGYDGQQFWMAAIRG